MRSVKCVRCETWSVTDSDNIIILCVLCVTVDGGRGRGNFYPPQFPPPVGCDEACWGYQPCNLGFTHPSWEGWNKTNTDLPDCAKHLGDGCCHTISYTEVVDEVHVPDVEPGHYVVRWRWDAEQSAQIWSGCGDIQIVSA